MQNYSMIFKSNVKIKLNSEKRSEFSIKFGMEWCMIYSYSVIIFQFCQIGHFGQNLAKSGQTLEIVSQPSGLSFQSNKYDFKKLNR